MSNVVDKLGQLFIMGFPGATPPAPVIDFIKEEEIGGVILFEDNCPSHDVTRHTIAQLRTCCRRSTPIVAVDQEGGRVSRVKGVPVEYRSAREYGAENTVDRFVEEYTRAAVYLESMGFNLNLAPVADLAVASAGGCLEGRCFSDEPAVVADFVTTSVWVAHQGGLLSCVKHFPGLGAAAIDPHKGAATAEYDELVWSQRERLPFAAAVDNGVDLVMTTHVVVPAIDDIIATGSRVIVSRLLRQSLRFDGPVITDDLCMAGAAVLGEIGERAVAAFNAGHDLLLFGQDYEAAMRAYDYFCDAVRRGQVDAGRVQSALARVAGLKIKLRSGVLR